MIRFCGQAFSSPQTFKGCVLPKFAGVYCFAVRDFDWSPLPLRPVYFGISEDCSERVTWSHEAVAKWISRGHSIVELHVSVLRVDEQSLRNAIERQLIDRYQPELNTQHARRNALARLLAQPPSGLPPLPLNALRTG